jgi:ATPase subunit of ABC transporter with duplicated ATPase domains
VESDGWRVDGRGLKSPPSHAGPLPAGLRCGGSSAPRLGLADQVQNHLGAFGFSGGEVFREIGTLSGGERARMALALMTLARANLLVLLVSHDRAFLRELATCVWSFDGTRLTDFDGPFIEWEEDGARRAACIAR